MKTITLSESEIETLKDYLWCNPCSAGCLYNYKRINCDDLDSNDKYRCKLKRDTQSILEKLGEQ